MLYIIATPIGNLKDITLRALEILKEVDLILAEDTRQTRKLLMHYEINKPLQSYHQHSRLQKIDWILDLLRQGKNLALVTDAGTPGIADPGNRLVEVVCHSEFISESSRDVLDEIPKRIRDDNGYNISISPIPGPCALTAALSISGLPTDKFLFLGFPPAKKKRQKFFEQVVNSKHTVVFYESCHRILRTLEDLNVILSVAKRSEESREYDGSSLRSFGQSPQDDINERQLVVCRELTKKFETIYRGDCATIISQLKKENHEPRGEFVVVVAPTP